MKDPSAPTSSSKLSAQLETRLPFTSSVEDCGSWGAVGLKFPQAWPVALWYECPLPSDIVAENFGAAGSIGFAKADVVTSPSGTAAPSRTAIVVVGFAGFE